jgi:hypothetical protein
MPDRLRRCRADSLCVSRPPARLRSRRVGAGGRRQAQQQRRGGGSDSEEARMLSTECQGPPIDYTGRRSHAPFMRSGAGRTTVQHR